MTCVSTPRLASGIAKAMVAALVVAGASCASTHRDVRSRSAHAIDAARAKNEGRAIDSPVVLVTIDGARWQEVFLGTDGGRAHDTPRAPREILPNLYRLAADRGALVGAPGRGVIKATGPNYVSLPGYTEILTGRSPLRCQDNDCPPVDAPTVLDEAYAAGAKVAAFASWEKLDRALTVAPGRFPVSCGRDGDPTIDPWPGHGQFRPDAITAYLALRHLVTELPDVLFLGLGEPDEYAHHDDYEGYVRSLSFADAILGQLFAVLDRMGERGASTHVFVTADHGRASSFRDHGGWAPESARVWLFAAGPTIAARGRVPAPGEHRLADVAPTIRVVLGLEGDRSDDAGRPLSELFGDRPSALAAAPVR
jgi:hypothetical protein